MAGVYYTKNEEEHPVFHVWSNCPTGSQILDKDRERALLTRDYCRDCSAMDYTK